MSFVPFPEPLIPFSLSLWKRISQSGYIECSKMHIAALIIAESAETPSHQQHQTMTMRFPIRCGSISMTQFSCFFLPLDPHLLTFVVCNPSRHGPAWSSHAAMLSVLFL